MSYYAPMLERVILGPRTVQSPKGIVEERSVRRYVQPDGTRVYAEPGHVNRRNTKLVPVFEALETQRQN